MIRNEVLMPAQHYLFISMHPISLYIILQHEGPEDSNPMNSGRIRQTSAEIERRIIRIDISGLSARKNRVFSWKPVDVPVTFFVGQRNERYGNVQITNRQQICR